MPVQEGIARGTRLLVSSGPWYARASCRSSCPSLPQRERGHGVFSCPHPAREMQRRHDHVTDFDFQQFSFRYPGADEAVFQDLTLCLDTDWKLALAGRNGRGKTTLLRLLSGDLPGGAGLSCPVLCRYFPAPAGAGDRRARHGAPAPGGPGGGRVDAAPGGGGPRSGPVRPGPSLEHPQRRGAHPLFADCPVRRGRLSPAGRAHRPSGPGGACLGGPLPSEDPAGLSAGLPRPGLPGRLHRPYSGAESDGGRADPRQLLRMAGGKAGPRSGRAGSERGSAWGDRPPAAGGPAYRPLVRPGGEAQIRRQKLRPAPRPGISGPQVRQDDEAGQASGTAAGSRHRGEVRPAPGCGAGRPADPLPPSPGPAAPCWRGGAVPAP